MDRNFENEKNKNEANTRNIMSVINKTQPWLHHLTLPQQPPVLQPITPYTQYYQQYLQQFVPYYYNLLTTPTPFNFNLGYSQASRMPPAASDMEIEKFINYELSRQQNLMNNQQQRQQQNLVSSQQRQQQHQNLVSNQQQRPQQQRQQLQQQQLQLQHRQQQQQLQQRQQQQQQLNQRQQLQQLQQLQRQQQVQRQQHLLQSQQQPQPTPANLRPVLAPLPPQIVRKFGVQRRVAPSQLRLLPMPQSAASQSAPPPAPTPAPQQQKRVLNVSMVSYVSRNGKGKPCVVEPLPPVEPAFKQRVAKIQKSQDHYCRLLGRLTDMLQTLNRRYDGEEPEPEPEEEEEPEQPPTEEAPPPPLKRARHESSSSSTSTSTESHVEAEPMTEINPHAQYPVRVPLEMGGFEYVLGPNGTRINSQQYGQVFWTDAPVATRCLLSAVFTSDELATHTLTGKPSPAFYGRERPPKKMLDPERVDDIVISVRNRTGGKERHIRATITTKCADTAKKYKRRAKKAGNNCLVIKEE